jgi:hypothetical protein
MQFTYNGSEAVEMLKTHFPKTWEQEINDGQIFIKSLMRMYKLSPLEAFQKYLNKCGSTEKGISTFASLHIMLLQIKIGDEIKELQEEQLVYGNQLTALEGATIISYEDKKTLRSHYLSKQNELQQRIEKLTFDYPVIGAEKIIVQLNFFDN